MFVQWLTMILAPFCCNFNTIWATSWQNKQNGMCAQQRLRSAWVSTQSDQSLRCRHCKDSDQTGQMSRLIWVFARRTDHFVGFVMQLICILQMSAKNENFEPKPTKWPVCPAKTQISLGICRVWSRVFVVRSMGSLGPKVSSRGKQRHWWDWEDAQADLRLWAETT